MQNAPLARLLTLTGGMLAATIATGTLAVRPQQTVPPVPVGSEVAKGLPAADPSKAATRFAKVVGWPEGTAPSSVAGFTVTLFAANLSSPRWLYVVPNGDVLVAESMGEPDKSPNTVTLLRDADQDGRAEVRTTLLQGVRQPFGMLLHGDQLYVANTNALVRYPYRAGDRTITAPATRVLELPAGGYNNHWTRNVVANADGSKLFVSVGSGTNVDEEKEDEKDPRRAAVLEVNPDGTGMRVYASGLRNPVGLAVHPESKELWAAVNERDMLGDELVPDYLTSVKEGAFYGWPYAYFGPIEIHARKANGRIWWRRRFLRTSRSARMSRRWAWPSTQAPRSLPGIATVRSWLCTAPGTGRDSRGTRSSSCLSSTASHPQPRRTSSPGSSRTRTRARSMAAPQVSRCSQTARCSWPTMARTACGGSAR